jgi:hypothetical protein
LENLESRSKELFVGQYSLCKQKPSHIPDVEDRANVTEHGSDDGHVAYVLGCPESFSDVQVPGDQRQDARVSDFGHRGEDGVGVHRLAEVGVVGVLKVKVLPEQGSRPVSLASGGHDFVEAADRGLVFLAVHATKLLDAVLDLREFGDASRQRCALEADHLHADFLGRQVPLRDGGAGVLPVQERPKAVHLPVHLVMSMAIRVKGAMRLTCLMMLGNVFLRHSLRLIRSWISPDSDWLLFRGEQPWRPTISLPTSSAISLVGARRHCL